MRLLSGGALLLVLVLLGGACTSPPPAPPPTSAPTQAPTSAPRQQAPTSAPTQAPTGAPAQAQAPASTASRTDVLNSANTAFLNGDMASAAQLYQRVTNTPPHEAPELATAITDFAYFRGAMALLASGDEDQARAQLDALQNRDPNAPLARLGTQLWDQYGMTAQLRAACAQVQPQIATQAAQTFATLASAGVTVDPNTVCSLPASG